MVLSTAINYARRRNQTRCDDVAEYVCEAYIDLTPGYRLLFTHEPPKDDTRDVIYSCWVRVYVIITCGAEMRACAVAGSYRASLWQVGLSVSHYSHCIKTRLRKQTRQS